jgi:hypothetical protein
MLLFVLLMIFCKCYLWYDNWNGQRYINWQFSPNSIAKCCELETRVRLPVEDKNVLYFTELWEPLTPFHSRIPLILGEGGMKLSNPLNFCQDQEWYIYAFSDQLLALLVFNYLNARIISLLSYSEIGNRWKWNQGRHRDDERTNNGHIYCIPESTLHLCHRRWKFLQQVESLRYTKCRTLANWLNSGNIVHRITFFSQNWRIIMHIITGNWEEDCLINIRCYE